MREFGWMIALGTLPIIVCGLAFKDYIETTLRSLYVMSAALAGVAVLLAIAEWWIDRRRAAGVAGREVNQVGLRDAMIVGFAQAAALVPGTSRSGATILGGLCCGLTREAAARFSFLLSIPSILAAGLFQLIEARGELLGSSTEAAKLGVALIVTAVVGYATIPWLLAYLAAAHDVRVHRVPPAAGGAIAVAAGHRPHRRVMNRLAIAIASARHLVRFHPLLLRIRG